MNRIDKSRRQFIALVPGVSAASLAATSLLGSNLANAKARTKPNIIFILADDLGYADLSVYGQRHFETPQLDKLAKQGVRFTQAYANSAVCSATRFGLITGRYQYRLRGGLEEPLSSSNNNIGLPAEHPTLPSLLKKQGYKTALFGKWHLGSLPTFGPLKSGYDIFFGNYGGALDYFTHKTNVGPDAKEGLFEGEVPVEKVGYYTDLMQIAQLTTSAPKTKKIRFYYRCTSPRPTGHGKDRKMKRSHSKLKTCSTTKVETWKPTEKWCNHSTLPSGVY